MALFRVIAPLVLDPVDPCAQISAFLVIFFGRLATARGLSEWLFGPAAPKSY
jgi:hypothetical protein